MCVAEQLNCMNKDNSFAIFVFANNNNEIVDSGSLLYTGDRFIQVNFMVNTRHDF